jgi:hypothetical protein
MALIAAEIFDRIQIALVDRRDHGEHIHVLHHLAVLVADDGAIGRAPGDAVDFGQGLPSARSTQVKSYSSRHTRSMALQAFRLFSSSIITLAPTKAIWMFGLRALISSAVRMSWPKLGVEVCRMTRSRSSNSCAISSQERSWAGASISLDPGTMAAGWASQVGYQKLLTSRFI